MLFEQSKALQEKQAKKKFDIEQEKLQKAHTVFTREQSNRLVERKKIQAFTQLFRILDSDGDSQISANRIDISSLNPETLEVLTPLLCEMEELG